MGTPSSMFIGRRVQMNKRKLRRILRESIRDVLSEGLLDDVKRERQPGPSHPTKGNCPSRYDWQRLVSVAQSMLMGRYRGYGEPPTGFVRAWNRYRNKGMNIPPILYDEVPNCATAIMQIGSRQYELTESDYKIVCENWMEDADTLDDFSWDYDPDGY